MIQYLHAESFRPVTFPWIESIDNGFSTMDRIKIKASEEIFTQVSGHSVRALEPSKKKFSINTLTNHNGYQKHRNSYCI